MQMIEKKILLLQKIPTLINQFNAKPTKYKSSLETSFETFLKHHPYDTEIWIKFALLLHCLIKDNQKAVECLNNVLHYNSNNVYVTMLLIFISENISPMNDKLFEMLCTLNSPNKEILSLIEYQKAWYYLPKDEELYRYTLEHSIELCDKFVWNHKALGAFYFFRNEIDIGRILFRKALTNIHHVYTSHEFQSVGACDINEFFNARLKGTHILQPMVFMMINAIEQHCIP